MSSPVLDNFGRATDWVMSGNGRFKSTEDDRYRLERPNLYGDMARLLGRDRYKALLNDARWIADTFPLVQEGAQQKAEYVSAAGWLPEFVGKDRAYGDRATPLLHAALSIADVRGELFDWDDIWENVGRLWDIDGGHFQLFTETEETGFPQLQNIEAHRIGQRTSAPLVGDKDAYTLVTDTDAAVRKVWGAYRGMRILNGIIYNSAGRQVAYRVLGATAEEDRDISALDMQHTCHARWFSEGRPAPSIAYSALDWYDVKEKRMFEGLAHKINSALTLVESNETGEAPVIPPMGGAASTPKTTGAPQEHSLFGGLVRYIRNGGTLKAHESNRPSSGWLEFDRTVVAGAFYGMGWRIEMMDLSLLSGAGVRGFQDNINMKILARHKKEKPFVLRAARRQFAKLIKRGDIEEHPEWHKWEIPQPPEFTVDAGRAQQADRDNIAGGIDSHASVIRRAFGYGHMKVLREEAQYLVDRREVAKEFALTDAEAAQLGRLDKPGQLPLTAAQDATDIAGNQPRK